MILIISYQNLEENYNDYKADVPMSRLYHIKT